MAKKQKSEATKSDPFDRIARLLAMIAVKNLEKEEAARRLLSVGFDSPQIGGILGVGPNFANVAKSRSPKSKG
ncbi:hypothetical protein [Pseudolabrys sp. Root1462]|uniref:hypothetical protein n=1 Tax=Pseudolabrys sp. Root1462 TaxID=1736466 RepID=UPI0012E3AE80|nr:hypothetical protein [Pseudolabrys sp. Root1462]